MANEKSREYPVPPGAYMYIQEISSGKIKTLVGPTAATLTGNEVPIVFEGGEFRRCDTLEDAIRKSVLVPEGSYCVLMNPARSSSAPPEGQTGAIPELQSGHEVVIEGPKMFALWPGQSAEVVDGHVLRSNQYLFCRVHNEEEAKANVSKARIVKKTDVAPVVTGEGAPQGGEDQAAAQPKTSEPTQEEKKTAGLDPESLTVGKTFVIKGTEFSFYIPQTGITVLRDENGNYVRDAVTLEQLEYCVLLDERGTKRYVRGPAVVFPEPTETFMKLVEVEDGEEVARTKFRAIELNEIQGIHIKITKSYHDDALKMDLKEGDEVFITGKHYPIYFPREEHVAVKYDGKMKHFAVAIPAGEGRYVMDRMTGTIEMVMGPAMLLPDPTKKIIVRRSLTDKECEQWYPGNQEVLAYNRALRELAKTTPTTRAGAVSEGDVERGRTRKGSSGEALRNAGGAAPVAVAAAMIAGMDSHNLAAYAAPARRSLMDSSLVSNERVPSMGDEISRSSTFTQPRTLMLNTKFEGAPRIVVWTGYAVQIVNAKGERRVVEGPANILLEYDEVLETLSLSTGKPKTTDNPLKTPYLLVKNNKVADLIDVETSDHVKVQIKVSYLVNFGGDKSKWFDVANYVKFLCDHMRSLLKAASKGKTIEEFYRNPLPIVRKVVLGEEEKGVMFEANNMFVADVELLDVVIPDSDVATMLRKAQRSAVERGITLADLRQSLDATKEQERIKSEEAQVKAKTEALRKKLEEESVAQQLAVSLARVAAALAETDKKKLLTVAQEAIDDVRHDAERAREKHRHEDQLAKQAAEQELDLARLKAETEALVSKFQQLQGGFSEALLALSSNDALIKVAEALSVQKLIGGQSAVEVLDKFFAGSGLQGVMEKISARVAKPLNGNGGKHTPAALSPSVQD